MFSHAGSKPGKPSAKANAAAKATLKGVSIITALSPS
jgi:hypothetical protein